MRLLMTGILLLALCACAEIEDRLHLAADGSGTVTLTVHRPIDCDGRYQMDPIYPPLQARWVRRLFPDPSCTIAVEEQDEGFTATVAFPNLAVLQASPWARIRQLELVKVGEEIVIRCQSGLQGIELLAGIPRDTAENLHVDPGVVDGLQRLRWTGGVSVGEHPEVTWTLSRQDPKDIGALTRELTAIREARFPAAGTTFVPSAWPRPGLRPVAELVEGRFTPMPVLDEAGLRAVIQLQPQALTVQRTFYFAANDRFYGYDPDEDQANVLTAALVLPPVAADLTLTSARITSARNDLGVDLAPPKVEPDPDRQERPQFRRNPSFDDEAPSGSPGAERDRRLPLRLPLCLGDRRARSIPQLEIGATLIAPGPANLVRLPRAIGAFANSDEDALNERSWYGGGTPIAPDRLAPLGLALIFLGGRTQHGVTSLQVTMTPLRSGARIDAFWIVDAAGRVLPTRQVLDNWSGSQSTQLLVLGTAQPPFDLILIVHEPGPELSLTFTLQDVPLWPEALPAATPMAPEKVIP